jgi:multiple sugar transport system substrate-binding protein
VQSGAVPFKIDGTNITINFTSPEVTRVATAQTMIDSGALAPVDTYSSEWQTAIGNGSIACWQAGAWGPEVIEPATPADSPFVGKWKAYLMPQWDAATPVNGNYGGSTIAVMKASQHPQEAATFDAWLNTDPAPTLALANGTAGLFPVTTETLNNPAWSDFEAPFWGNQKLHELTAQAAQTVGLDWQWPPFTAQVYTDYAAEVVKVKAGTETISKPWPTCKRSRPSTRRTRVHRRRAVTHITRAAQIRATMEAFRGAVARPCHGTRSCSLRR